MGGSAIIIFIIFLILLILIFAAFWNNGGWYNGAGGVGQGVVNPCANSCGQWGAVGGILLVIIFIILLATAFMWGSGCGYSSQELYC